MSLDIEATNRDRLGLYQQLLLYGDICPLNFKIDMDLLNQELDEFRESWVVYNQHKGDTGRLGLSVTSLDGGLSGYPDLQSLYEHAKITGEKVSENQFNQPTPVLKKCSSLQPLMNHFEPGWGRCRLVKFRPGGFFPPHRDQSIQFQVPDYFRILVPLMNTGEDTFYFIYDGRKISYEPGRAYLFNALKTHSVFSFAENVVTFAMSLQLTQKNVTRAISALLVR